MLMLSVACSCSSRRDFGDNSQATSSYESQLLYTSIQEAYPSCPGEALARADEGEIKGLLTPLQSNTLRYYIFNYLGSDSRALYYIDRVVADPTFKRLSETEQLELLIQQVKVNIALARYSVALATTMDVLERARIIGDNVLLAEGDILVSIIYIHQHLYVSGQEYATRAYNRLKDANSLRELSALAGILEQSIANTITIDLFIPSDWLLAQMWGTIQRMENYPDCDLSAIDLLKASYYSKAALIYQKEGKPEDAAKAYEGYLGCKQPRAMSNKDIISYLGLIGNYSEALSLLPPLSSYGKDTIRLAYYNDLKDRGWLLYHLHRVPEAVRYHLRSDVIKDSLNTRNILSATIESETSLVFATQRAELAESQQVIHRQQTLLGVLLGVSIALLFLIPLSLYTFRSLKKKDETFASQIDGQVLTNIMLDKSREELRSVKGALSSLNYPDTDGMIPVSQHDGGESDYLSGQFAVIDKIVEERRLYLDPEFDREEMEKETAVPKATASKAIKHVTGENFAVYVNSKRLAHSVLLLRDYDNYTIEAVALDSGFGDVRNYYRVFRDKFGVTPSTYRETYIRKSQGK